MSETCGWREEHVARWSCNDCIVSSMLDGRERGKCTKRAFSRHWTTSEGSALEGWLATGAAEGGLGEAVPVAILRFVIGT